MSETTSLVERVARAIYHKFEDRPVYAQIQMNGIIAEECARAAIEAMLTPTPEMIAAAAAYSKTGGSFAGMFKAMISAALAPLPTEETP